MSVINTLSKTWFRFRSIVTTFSAVFLEANTHRYTPTRGPTAAPHACTHLLLRMAKLATHVAVAIGVAAVGVACLYRRRQRKSKIAITGTKLAAKQAYPVTAEQVAAAAGAATASPACEKAPVEKLHWDPMIERRGLGDLVHKANHIAIIVSDVGRAAAWYSDVLGTSDPAIISAT